MVGGELGERAEPRYFADREAALGCDPRSRGRGARHIGELLGDDECAGSAVGEDVRDLVADEVVVDGRVVEADLRRREDDRVDLDLVAEEIGDAVAGLEPQAAEPVRDAVGLREQFRVAHRPLVGLHDGETITVVRRPPPEPDFAELRHVALLRVHHLCSSSHPAIRSAACSRASAGWRR